MFLTAGAIVSYAAVSVIFLSFLPVSAQAESRDGAPAPNPEAAHAAGPGGAGNMKPGFGPGAGRADQNHRPSDLGR